VRDVVAPPDVEVPPPRRAEGCAAGRSGVVALGEEECWALLRSQRSGRLAYTVAALPAVVPVSCAVVDHDVVVAAGAEEEVLSAARGAVVALQVDGTGPDRCTVWSVTAVGPARVLADPHLALELRGGGLAPWTGSPVAGHLLLAVRLVSGVRAARPPSA